MNQPGVVIGLNCPSCGGMVPIPEGQVIVFCPFCDLRSIVHGQRGVRRYQVPLVVDEERAIAALERFLSNKRIVSTSAAKHAELTEVFVVYTPFWVFRSYVLGWIFGEGVRFIYGEGGGTSPPPIKGTEAVPYEVMISEDMDWSAAACDAGELGVDSVCLTDQQVEPYDAEYLHNNGLVFEPFGSVSNAKATAMAEIEAEIEARTLQMAELDFVEQSFLRYVRPQMDLVFYPMWVLRYTYRERAYHVVVDGHSGNVLYGKAPGNILLRAAALVGGMALGAFLIVEVGGLLGIIALHQTKGGFLWPLFAVGIVWVGISVELIRRIYRRFRYGKVYEYRALNE